MAEEIVTSDLKELGEGLWKLKNQKKFCDATITVDGEKIEVHAAVLSSRNEFFEKIFENNEITPKNLNFVNFDKNNIQSLIEYFYKGTIKITEKSALEVFRLANDLNMPNIREACIKIMKKMLNAENSLAMWKVTKSTESEPMKRTILEFILENLEKVIASPDFSALEKSDLIEILSSKSNDAPEMTVYETVKKWITHDSSRDESLDDLLNYVKLECLPRDFLLSESQLMCGKNSTCLLNFISAVSRQQNNISMNCSNVNTLSIIGTGDQGVLKYYEIFDKNKQEWVEFEYNECNKNYFSAVMVNDSFMTIGGIINGHTTKTVEYYDIKTGRVESLQPMKEKRNRFAATNFGQYVYVFGGLSGNHLASGEKWDSSTKTWQDIAPMMTARHGCAVAVFGNEIFVVGGYNSKYISDVEAYNPEKNTWRKCKSMNETRNYCGLATVGNYLYVVGGRNDERLKSVERYDPKIDKWTTIRSMEIIRSGPAVVNWNEQLVAAGGVSNRGFENTIEVYDEKNDQWKPMTSMKKPRSAANLVVLPWNLAKIALERKA